MSLNNLSYMDSRYIDPLYRPYHTDYSHFPFHSANTNDTQYPLVDPYRRHMGFGLNFRSKHDGYCPQGWTMGEHNQCLKNEEEVGNFYTNKRTKCLNKHSNNKIPYNENLCSTNDYLSYNGKNNDTLIKRKECILKYFW